MNTKGCQSKLRIVVVCKVIDNYGDAGFCLRLGRALAHSGHAVWIAHNSTEVFSWMHDPQECPKLTLVEYHTSTHPHPLQSLQKIDLVLEPFGSSSEQTQHRFDETFKKQWPRTPWLVIDYLSAETWIEDFHLKPSTNPTTGHQSTFFFPGFNNNTGGLIHNDMPTQTPRSLAAGPLKLFVFCYPNAPQHALKKASQATALWCPPSQLVAQWRFDNVLQDHDVLFVRGEDSFVRAQLAGKPLVWQIYPCQDFSHIHKLKTFFELYTKDMATQAKQALWQLWEFWNQLIPNKKHCTQQLWDNFYQHLTHYQSHAITWQHQLRQNKDLTDEVLSWHAKQTQEQHRY